MTLPTRFHRLRAALDRRQPDLTVLLEEVRVERNLAGILRTCDAVGVFAVHAVWGSGKPHISRPASGGTRKWLPVRTHPTLEAAVAALRGEGFRLLAAHPDEISPLRQALAGGGKGGNGRLLAAMQPVEKGDRFAADTPAAPVNGRARMGEAPGRATPFREADYTRPTALLLGNEDLGLSPQALAAADERVSIPMSGLGTSLNVSVAAALLLFEAQRQRTAAGLYSASRLDQEIYDRTLFEWAHPKVAAHCRRRDVPYPALDDDGEIVGVVPR